MSDDTYDLSPCPFCGGEAKAFDTLAGCTVCGACGPESPDSQFIEKNWNGRTSISDEDLTELIKIAKENTGLFLATRATYNSAARDQLNEEMKFIRKIEVENVCR